MRCFLARKFPRLFVLIWDPRELVLRLSNDDGFSDNKEGVKSFLEKRPPNFTGTIQKDAPSAYPWWRPVSVLGWPKLSRL